MRVRYSITITLLTCLIFLGYTTAYSINTIKQNANNKPTLENVVFHTRSQKNKITAHSEFNMTFNLHDQSHDQNHELRLQLEPNHDILALDAHVQYIDASGNAHTTESIERASHKVFRGGVWWVGSGGWEDVGWARVFIVRDGEEPLFEGSFSFFAKHYRVEVLDTIGDGISSSRMAAYRADMQHEGYNQSSADTFRTTGFTQHTAHIGTASKRQYNLDTDELIQNIGSTSGCPTTRGQALVGIATDCAYTASFDSTGDLRRNVISIVNTASEVFERSFNISLSLHNLTITDSTCPDSDSASVPWNVDCSEGDLNWRLQRFSSWRGSLGDRVNAYWTLLTGCPSRGQVGVSWIGALCNSESSVNVVAKSASEWQTFAHESAHTFGAVHDCDSNTCSSGAQCCPLSSSSCDAGGQYIMNPVSTSSQQNFSSCTIGTVCSQLGSWDSRMSCLLSNDDNVPPLTIGECGNGIVEVGEDCDCGDSCDDNDCCDGSTCRFRDGAVCDDSAGPCCMDCQFEPIDTVCRASTGFCDIRETCTGNSSICPTDRHVPDGQTCGDDKFCASGECTNRDIQCQGALDMNGAGVSCNNDTCTLSCSDGSGSCMDMTQQILDGTPCSGGLCRNGQCQQDTGDSSWVDRHRPLVIGLCVGIGGALVIAAIVSVVCVCRSRRHLEKH